MTTIRELLPWRRDERRLTAREVDPFLSLQSQMNNLFHDCFRGDWIPFGAGAEKLAQPRMDVIETPDEFRFELELPGVAEEDVEISLDGDLLTIRGEKKAEVRSEKDGVHRVERSYGSFERRVGLAGGVDAEKAEATFDKGVLTVRLPKREEEKVKTRTIPVRSQS